MDEISIVKGLQRRDMEMFKLLVKKHSPKAIRTAYFIIRPKTVSRRCCARSVYSMLSKNTQRQELGKNLIKAAGFNFAMANTSMYGFFTR